MSRFKTALLRTDSELKEEQVNRLERETKKLYSRSIRDLRDEIVDQENDHANPIIDPKTTPESFVEEDSKRTLAIMKQKEQYKELEKRFEYMFGETKKK